MGTVFNRWRSRAGRSTVFLLMVGLTVAGCNSEATDTTAQSAPDRSTAAPSTSGPGPGTQDTVPREATSTAGPDPSGSTTGWSWPETMAPSQPRRTRPTPEGALAQVEDHYRAINAGSLPHGIAGEMRFANPEGLVAFDAVVRFECRFEGLVGRDRVLCTEWIYDDFYGPAGLTNTAETAFDIMEDCSLCAQTPGLHCPAADSRWDAESLLYLTRFEDWLATHHPDVTRWIWVERRDFMAPTWQGNPCSLYPIENRPDPNLYGYLAEFIDWSDDYPIEGSAAWAAERFNRIVGAGLAPGAPASPDYSWQVHVTGYSCDVERDWGSADELMQGLGGDTASLLHRRMATVMSICPDIDRDELSAAIHMDLPGLEIDDLRDLAGAMYLAAG